MRSVDPIRPGPGQESVWDHPRPPRLDHSREKIVVTFGGEVICTTHRSIRVLETSHPPTYYLPTEDFTRRTLEPSQTQSVCEWKGDARYFDIRTHKGHLAARAAWGYPNPLPGFEALRGHVALYAGLMDECTVDGEVVQPQPGGFYGGWVTSRVVGPFKGVPGSGGW